MSNIQRLLRGTLLTLLCMVPLAHADDLTTPPDVQALQALAGEPSRFLPVHEAFQARLVLIEGALRIDWTIAPGYYLYKDRLTIEPVSPPDMQLGVPAFPGARTKDDPYFGAVEVFESDFSIDIPVQGAGIDGAALAVEFQGCASAGLCYPPTRVQLAAGKTPPPVAENAATPLRPAGASGRMAQTLDNQPLLAALAVFLIAGLGLGFTPCVLPMVPILSSIVLGAGTAPGRPRAWALAGAYVLSMSAALALMGLLMALFGASLNLQARLQSPWFLVPFAALFVVFAASLFGLFELQMPAAWRHRVDGWSRQQRGGSLAGAAAMGVLSTLVVSPCVSAPLAGALIYISQSQDALLGSAALFALGLGMGLPLFLLAGAGAHWLPKAGAWMESVKNLFGLLLLGVAVWLLERLLPGPLVLLLWAALLLAAGTLLGALDLTGGKAGWSRLGQTIGLVMVGYGFALILGAAAGASDPLRPLGSLTTAAAAGGIAADPAKRLGFIDVYDGRGLHRQVALAASSGRWTFVDVYADWCISCKELERRTFPAVQDALSGFHRVRADVTAFDGPQQAMLTDLDVIGPPTLMFFDPSGKELREARIVGEISIDALRSHLLRLSAG